MNLQIKENGLNRIKFGRKKDLISTHTYIQVDSQVAPKDPEPALLRRRGGRVRGVRSRHVGVPADGEGAAGGALPELRERAAGEPPQLPRVPHLQHGPGLSRLAAQNSGPSAGLAASRVMRTEDRSVELSVFNINVHQFSQYLEMVHSNAFTMQCKSY